MFDKKEYMKKYQKQYYLDHLEYAKQYAKQRRLDRKEERKEYNKQYCLDHPEYHKQYCLDHPGHSKQWRLDHPGYDKQYRQTPEGKISSQRNHSKRRAIGREIINTLTAGEWIDILMEYKFKCAYCGKEFTLFNRETKDHVIPISKGGNNTKENIVPACRSCNSRKHDKVVDMVGEVME